MRLIDADALKKDIETEWLTPQTKMAFFKIIDDAPTVSEITKEKLSIAYDQGYEDGKNNWMQEEKPQGECENCPFKKFSEDMVDKLAKVMIDNDIKIVLSKVIRSYERQ